MFFEMIMDKKVKLNYKPWMDIFIAMNGSDVVSKILDFGDNFIKKMIKWYFLARCYAGKAPSIKNIEQKPWLY